MPDFLPPFQPKGLDKLAESAKKFKEEYEKNPEKLKAVVEYIKEAGALTILESRCIIEKVSKKWCEERLSK